MQKAVFQLQGTQLDMTRLEISTLVKIQVQVIWVVTPCSVVVRYHFQQNFSARKELSVNILKKRKCEILWRSFWNTCTSL